MNAEQTILDALLTSGEAYVSGSRIARELGISRPAVWARLEKLRSRGFQIEAVRNRGYRLGAEPEDLHPELLECLIRRRGYPMPVVALPETDSTNSEAERRLLAGMLPPFVVVATRQTAGRGRLGRPWFSASDDNLYLTLVLAPEAPAQEVQHFTLWAGIHICRWLREMTGETGLQLKWPNDIHCDGRKLAGMLTEGKMEAGLLRRVLFGIGINVNSPESAFPDALRPIATSLLCACGRRHSLNRIAAEVVGCVTRALATCLDGGDEPLANAWATLDALAGKEVSSGEGAARVSGTAEGIDASGALRIRLADGRLAKVRAGEVG